MPAFLLLLAFFQAPDELHSKLLSLIGGLPDLRAPLNARVTGVFERPGYRVEKVVFDSLPNFRVTADLYIPLAGQPPFPAVLGVAGHSDNGKASATYQHAWITLARRGYVVLAYDPPGQGERIEYFDPELGRSRLSPGVNEHNSAGLQCLLTGAPIARYFVWDGVRAFDYLTTRKEVDPKRIAVAGNSGGGTQAALLAAFEPRLAAAVSSCYITRWKELLEGPGPQDSEQILPGFLAQGLDFVDYIKAFSPRPFLITSAVRDYFPIAGARATFEAARSHYAAIDAPGRIAFFEYDDTHGWSQPRREAAYRFLDTQLKGIGAEVQEAPLQTEPESALWVTPTGQLATSFGGETVFSLNRGLAAQVFSRRKALSVNSPDQLRALVRERLQVPQISRLARTSPPGLAPAVLATGVPKADVDALRAAGFLVRSVDPPAFPAGRGGYSGAYQAAAKQWLYSKSLVGLQTAEIEGAMAELRAAPNVDPSRILLWARGNAGVPALAAAALDGNLAAVLLEQTVTSWFSITQWRLHQNAAEIIVPGVLQDFDLPDLAAILPPQSLFLADPRTPTGARALPTEYNKGTFAVLERPEGWPVTAALAPFLLRAGQPARPAADLPPLRPR
ncbi:MAG: acetylxylan esterase [Acidobacteria bacterium]|nr:acetylxylan esterase [Acidobacteriota bacterium]